jgi:MurNAc alpha-1-phosphate uridylyltransferase
MLTNMKAMILAAGVGSRLKQLTQSTPKCLMQAGGKTLLEHVIIKLKAAGVTELAINVHHHAEQVTSFLLTKRNFGLPIHISYESTLLDTGGGVKKVQAFFEDESAFIVHNADVYCTAPLQDLLDAHSQRNAVATLAVMKRESQRGLFFNNSMQLVGWSEESGRSAIEPTSSTLFAFSGISICSHELFGYMSNEPKFSIIEPFLAAARANSRVYGEVISAHDWVDIGTPENLQALQKKLELSSKKSP